MWRAVCCCSWACLGFRGDKAYSPAKSACQLTVRQRGQVFVKAPIIWEYERSSGVVFSWIGSPPCLLLLLSVIAVYFAMLKSKRGHFSEAPFNKNLKLLCMISFTTENGHVSRHWKDHRLITDQTLLTDGITLTRYYYHRINFKSGRVSNVICLSNDY